MAEPTQIEQAVAYLDNAYSSDPELRQAVNLLLRDRKHLCARAVELEAKLNTPETEDWLAGVMIEAGHQRARWPSEHDSGKSPLDWFWLIGFLAQKAAASAVAGDIDKARHHTISTAAALANWHLALSGVDTSMRPGIAAPAGVA